MDTKTAEDAIWLACKNWSIVLKEKQLEAVMEHMKGKDVFVSLPTGYVKSMIYALLLPIYDLIQEVSARNYLF